MTLQERCLNIREQYGVSLNASRLFGIYLNHNIKLKNVDDYHKKSYLNIENRRVTERWNLFKSLKRTYSLDLPIYFIDETTFFIK